MVYILNQKLIIEYVAVIQSILSLTLVFKENVILCLKKSCKFKINIIRVGTLYSLWQLMHVTYL